MPSLRSHLVTGFLRAARANRIFVSADAAERHVVERSIRPRPYGPPARLRTDVDIRIDHSLGWPVYTITPRAGEPRGSVVYAHGGAWVNEVAPQHWQLVAQLAVEAS